MFEQLKMMSEGGYAAPEKNWWDKLINYNDAYAVDAANKLKMDRLKKVPTPIEDSAGPWMLMSAQNEEQREPASMPVPPVAQTAVPKSTSSSISVTRGVPAKSPYEEDDYLAKLQEAFAANKDNTGKWLGEQNNVANTLVGQRADVDFSPLMAYVDSWNNTNTLQRGYSKPQSQEEKLAIVQQLKNGILKAQQGLSEDEMNMFKTLYGAKTDKEKFDAQQKLAWANYGLEKDKVDVLRQKAAKKPKGKELSQTTLLNVNEGNVIPSMLADISETIEGNQDLFGPVTWGSSMNPWNERSKTIDSQMRSGAQAFGKFMEGGVLRKEDEDKYRKMFPNLSDTPEVAANKLAIVNKLLVDKQNSNLRLFNDQGFDMSGLRTLDSGELPEILTSGQPKAKMSIEEKRALAKARGLK